MRYLLSVFISIFVFSSNSPAENINIFRQSTNYSDIISNKIVNSSLQFSIYSYKPSLGDLNDLLLSIGIPKTSSELMPSLSIVINHLPQIDSRIELGYWSTDLSTTSPDPLTLNASLTPFSYQLIYRPELLYNYIPIYIGGGIGYLRANFSGNLMDTLEAQGITLANNATNTFGYVFIGAELLNWEANPGSEDKFGMNASINIEIKRILKTIETTTTPPLNIVLDGTAIGLGVRTKF
ncbi:hypothetical protein JT359_18240 [Candidatus Poribacteria bacterium]|nr:hypothetical protein [Candidatus Poribacteria bacterium]